MTAPQQPGSGPDAANQADRPPQYSSPGSSSGPSSADSGPADSTDPAQGRHAASGLPGSSGGAGSPGSPGSPEGPVPTDVATPDATQVISSALEGGPGGAQSSDSSSDATQVVGTGTPSGGFPPPGSAPGGYPPPSPTGYPPPGQQPYGGAPGAPGGTPGWPSAEPPRPPQAQPQPPAGQPPQAPPPPPGWGQQQYGQPQQPGPYGAPPPPQQQWGQQQQPYGQPGPYGAPPPPQQQWGQQQQPYGQPGQQYPQSNSPSGFGGPATRGDYAEWPQRALGGLIDYVAPIVAFYILRAIFGVLPGVLAALLTFLVWLGLIGFMLWNSYRGGVTGQTIGRKYAKVKLISEHTGQPIGGGMGIGRHLVHIVEFGIGWFAPLFTAKKQTFADMILSTVVVRADDSRR
jgi:uncharacterized RDD family membrane protein YckC